MLEYKPLNLQQRRKQLVPKQYEYAVIDLKTAMIRITTEKYKVETLVDLDTINLFEKEVYQIYALINKANTPYLHISRKGGKIMLSRFIMGVDITSDLVVDHINGNSLDNRRENLRVVRHKDNMRNRKQNKNQHGFRGVHPAGGHYKKNGIKKYQAILNLGTFNTPEEAALAYKEAFELIFPGVMHEDQW